MLKLRKEFKLTKVELSTIQELDEKKPNLPDSILTEKEKRFFANVYYMYIQKYIDNHDWNKDLDDVEYKEKWASGNKTTRTEAQRLVISHLVTVNRWGNLTDKDAAKKLKSLLISSRVTFRSVIFYAYQD